MICYYKNIVKYKSSQWTPLANKKKLSRYEKFCEKAGKKPRLLKNFRSNPDFGFIVENVSRERGQDYLQRIVNHKYFDESQITHVKKNDLVGNPNLERYKMPFGEISPNTLRYFLNALNIYNFTKNDSIKNVVEVGGGYGGLGRVLSCFISFCSYTIFDLQSVNKLQKSYIDNYQNIADKFSYESEPRKSLNSDLFISNYAFSELGEELQKLYYENLILKCKKAYLILNRGKVSREVFLNMAKDDFNIEIKKEYDLHRPNGEIYYTKLTKKN